MPAGLGVVRLQAKAVAASGVDVQFSGHFELLELLASPSEMSARSLYPHTRNTGGELVADAESTIERGDISSHTSRAAETQAVGVR